MRRIERATARATRRFPSGGTYRRHVTSHGKLTPLVLAKEHAAIVEARTLYPGTRRSAADALHVLKSGVHQRKLGKTVLKGRWRGFPIYALTPHERTRRRMALCRGVYPIAFTPSDDDAPGLAKTLEAIEILKYRGAVADGDRVLVTKGDGVSSGGTNTMKIMRVGDG